MWAKPLAGNAIAIALVNHANATSKISASIDAIAVAYPSALPWTGGGRIAAATEVWMGAVVDEMPMSKSSFS